METQIFKTAKMATEFLLRNQNQNITLYNGRYKMASVMCGCGETECLESINSITEETEVVGVCEACGE